MKSEDIIKKGYGMLGQEYYDSRKGKKGTSYYYNELLEFPTTLSLLGNVKGKKILDLGCGPGIHTRKLDRMGAHVRGIDISDELIEIARKEAPNIEFTLGDVNSLPYKSEEFDIVVSSLVLGHIKGWTKVLSEVKRILKQNGIFVFSGYNPVTEKFVKKRWFFRKYRELNGYFEENEKRTKWHGDNDEDYEMIHYHKTYGTIVRLLVKNGFEIIDYEDCKPPKSAEKEYARYYHLGLNYPHFCVWKVKKK